MQLLQNGLERTGTLADAASGSRNGPNAAQLIGLEQMFFWLESLWRVLLNQFLRKAAQTHQECVLRVSPWSCLKIPPPELVPPKNNSL
jgi:hypothetical protein